MDIRSLQEQLGAGLDQAATHLGLLRPEILLLLFVIPLLLAVVSGRLLVILGAIVLVTASIVVLVRPTLTEPVLAFVLWVTGTSVAAGAIAGRRAQRALQTRLDGLQEELNALQVRESQRYFAELRYGHAPADAENKTANSKSPAS